MSRRFKREQLRLKEEILQGALHIAECDGWSAVSIRKIAARIEYSTTKVYELFTNKEQIMLELLQRGFGRLAEQLEQVRQSDASPKDKAVTLAIAYCRYAWENKAYYRIMYGMDGVPFGVAETWQEGMRIGEICGAILSEYLPHYSDQQIEEAVYACWGTLHGLVSLCMSGRMYGEHMLIEQLAVQSVMALAHSKQIREDDHDDSDNTTNGHHG